MLRGHEGAREWCMGKQASPASAEWRSVWPQLRDVLNCDVRSTLCRDSLDSCL